MSSIIEAMLSPDVEKTSGFNDLIRVETECKAALESTTTTTTSTTTTTKGTTTTTKATTTTTAPTTKTTTTTLTTTTTTTTTTPTTTTTTPTTTTTTPTTTTTTPTTTTTAPTTTTTTTTITTTVPDCTSGWEYLDITGKCYKVIKDKVTWGDARKACQSETGDLVSISNDEVNQFIDSNLVKTGEDYWIGGHQDPADNWMWTDRSKVGYESWSPGEPDGKAPGCKSDCNNMVWKKGLWSDRKHSDKNNYICQSDSPNGIRRKRSNHATDPIEINQVFLGGCNKQRKKREGNNYDH